MKNVHSDFGIRVFDNFLSPTYFNQLKSKVLSSEFSWSYHDNITVPDREKNKFNTDELWQYGFSHLVVFNEVIHSQEILDLMLGFHSQILDFSGCEWVIRSRFDMTTFTNGKRKHVPHVDLFVPNITCVFYLTDSDAPTEIYDERISNYEIEDYHILYPTEKLYNFNVKKRILPKENRIVMFDGSYFHSGFSSEEYKNRVTVNINVGKRY
jgi:hypothetical protein